MQTETSFGARLRHERERRKVSIETIASNTKILGALLEGLENDDVSRWPSGLYRRAFIRAYARAIGLDPEPVVREFVERFPEPEETSAPAHDAVAPAPARRIAIPMRFHERASAVIFDGFVLTFIALSFYLVFGAFWAPFSLGAVIYYFGSIMALGNTPGVYVFAPSSPGNARLKAASRPVQAESLRPVESTGR